MRRAAGVDLACVGSPATPREARPFHRASEIERDRVVSGA